MIRLLAVLILTSSSLLTFVRGAAPPADDPSKKPFTTAPGEMGDHLRKWHKEDTAAGNVALARLGLLWLLPRPTFEFRQS
jgi:hypothetical protein